VTVLFADLKGSMELLADRDPEDARKLLDPVLERMMEAVHRYEGTVNQVMGDGIMALFGAPLAHEDHAVRACYAALRMQESVKRYADEVRHSQGVAVRIRVGLNSGEVVVRAIGSDLHMDYSAVGQTTHLAGRMEQLADPGAILLTGETLRLAEGYVEVKPLGPVPVKGLAWAVDVYELVGAGAVRSRLHAAAARGLSRFVGRDTELAQLRQALERAGGGHGQLVAVVGEPGVGKSRLYWEFTHSHRSADWLILETSSVSYGRATAYLPVIDLLKRYFQIEARDDSRRIREKATGKLLALDPQLEPWLPALLALLDVPVDDPRWERLDPLQRRQRILDGVKRLLLRESQVQPLLILVEDLHWIDSETQALLDGLIESLPSARLLLLVSYRPEYQHGWAGKTYYRQLHIDPLPPESATDLLADLLGLHPSLEPLKRLLTERTEGNPLFLEESVRTLVETGVLIGARGAHRLAKDVTGIQVPATVQALLAARIDRLVPEDKRLLQAAAVIGKDVPLALLQAVAELPNDSLTHGLARLQAAEFLYEIRLFPDLEYTFKHALTATRGSLIRPADAAWRSSSM
jgi:class 3 adenylate cyclase